MTKVEKHAREYVIQCCDGVDEGQLSAFIAGAKWQVDEIIADLNKRPQVYIGTGWPIEVREWIEYFVKHDSNGSDSIDK